TGPFLPQQTHQRLRRQTATKPNLRVLNFVTDCDLLLDCADRVVAMGGYNTVCEVLSVGKPALIVPRVNPRKEQLIRAERLRARGFLEILHPDDLTPQALSAWLARDLKPPPSAHVHINLNGMVSLPHLLEEVLAIPFSAGQRKRSARIVTH